MKKFAKATLLFALILTLGVMLFGCGGCEGTYVCKTKDSEITLTLEGDDWSAKGDTADTFGLVTSGKYEVKSGKISLKWITPVGSELTVITGTVEGDTITLEVESSTLIFTKSGS